ncbi:MAG: hypothetical protein IJX84_08650 [Clostridia bacterium]|nr:hypothetical protein [Clostridia bacterium]
MTEFEQLEAMGYRFRLEGEQIRYRIVGTPPPHAAELFARLDRAQVRHILEARAAGYTVVKPDVLVVPWPDRYRYMAAIKAAQLDGKFISVQVVYRKSTRECVYYLTPPGVDLQPYLKEVTGHDAAAEGLC